MKKGSLETEIGLFERRFGRGSWDHKVLTCESGKDSLKCSGMNVLDINSRALFFFRKRLF